MGTQTTVARHQVPVTQKQAKKVTEGTNEYVSYLKNVRGVSSKSIGNYLFGLSNALEAAGINEDVFYSTHGTLKHRRWRLLLLNSLHGAQRGRNKREKKRAQNAICAFDSYNEYVLCRRVLASLSKRNAPSLLMPAA